MQKALMHAIMNFRYKKYNLAKIKVSKSMSVTYPTWNEIEKDKQENILNKLNDLVNQNSLTNIKMIIRNQLAYDLTKESINEF